MIHCQTVREHFVQGLPLDESDFRDHLAGCGDCQAVLEGIVIGDRVLAEPVAIPIPIPPFEAIAPVAAKAASGRRKAVTLKRRLPFFYTGVGAAAAAALLIVGLLAARAYVNRPPVLARGMILETKDAEKKAVSAMGVDIVLATGSLEVLPGVENEERVFMPKGQASFSVPKLGRGRSLSVRTPDAEVIVHGTRFQVSRAKNDTVIQVSEGLVEVRPEGVGRAPLFLGAGQSATIASVESYRESVRQQVLRSLDQSDFSTAEHSLDQLLGVGSTDIQKAEAKALFAWSLAARGKRSQAIAHYRQAMDLLPEGARFLWADNACAELALLVSEVEPGEASSAWRAYLRRFPSGVHAALARTKLGKGI